MGKEDRRKEAKGINEGMREREREWVEEIRVKRLEADKDKDKSGGF